MHLPLILLAAVVAAVIGFWHWLGAPVAMPPSPLAAGEKLHCVSYAPFRGGQNPLSDATYIDAKQIDEDLARLAAVTDCVRTYSIEHGLDQVPAIAQKHGLKVLQGLWLSSHPAKNKWQEEGVIALANKHRDVIRGVVVGNEVLLRGEMGAIDLAATIRRVKAAVPVPVTYADVWEFWVRNRDLAATVDFITIHILPYWEDVPIAADKAAAHVQSIYNEVAKIFPGREILIGETGWPSAGRMREGALPSASAQARVLHDTLAVAKTGGYRVNVIEAFDQPWKRALEGTVGGHWGLYDADTRAVKFRWGDAISDHPAWKLQAGLGALLAIGVFAAAFFAGRGRESFTAATWAGVALIALSAGASIGLVVEKMPVESLGIGGWMRSIAAAALALAVPLAVAAGLGRSVAIPGFARVLGAAGAPDGGALPRLLGVLAVALTLLALQVALGLVFDPRYKDFPNAALIGPVVAIAVLALLRRAPREGGLAERGAAALLLAGAVYIVLNETLANTQALAFAALILVLGLSLLRVAGVRTR